MFAYGSGYTASMFSLRVSETADLDRVFGQRSSPACPLSRLTQRTAISHAAFLDSVKAREGAVDKGGLLLVFADLRIFLEPSPALSGYRSAPYACFSK